MVLDGSLISFHKQNDSIFESRLEKYTLFSKNWLNYWHKILMKNNFMSSLSVFSNFRMLHRIHSITHKAVELELASDISKISMSFSVNNGNGADFSIFVLANCFCRAKD